MCSVGLLSALAISAPIAAAPVPTRLVTLGDSITYGVGASERSETSYAALLAKKLDAQLINLGIPGETTIPEPNAYFSGKTVHGDVYAPRLGVLADEVPRIPPDTTVVTLWIGTNDLWLASQSINPDYSNLNLFSAISADYDKYISATITAIHTRAPHARVLVASNINPADRGNITTVSQGPALEYRKAMTNLVNQMNAAIAAQEVEIVDLNCDAELYNTDNYLTPVDLHPNDRGHARIADDFFNAIENGGTAKPCIYGTVLMPAASQPLKMPNYER